MSFMNAMLVSAVGAVALLVTGVVSAQNGHMMDGSAWGMGWMGGFGGGWLTILVVVVVAGLVAWGIKQKGK